MTKPAGRKPGEIAKRHLAVSALEGGEHSHINALQARPHTQAQGQVKVKCRREKAAILAFHPWPFGRAPRQAQHPRNSVARCILTHARNESSMPEASPGALRSSLAGVALTWVALYEDGGLWPWQPCRMRLVRQGKSSGALWPHISLHSVSNTRSPL